MFDNIPKKMSSSSSGSGSSNSRRIRTPRSAFFSDSNPDMEMFFDTSPTVTFPRSHLATRLGSSVFDDFPSLRMRSNFSADHPSFGSLRHRPSWVGGGGNDSRGSKESLHSDSEGNVPRHHEMHRADSLPMHVSHGSRSSTPESSGSGSATSRHSGGAPEQSYEKENSAEVEEHPMATSKCARQPFTARRQPKVHHIPIHVEPRDTPYPNNVTPPTVDSPPVPEIINHEKRGVPSSPPLPPPPTTASSNAIPLRRGDSDAKEAAETRPSTVHYVKVEVPEKAPETVEKTERITPKSKPPRRNTPMDVVEDVRREVEEWRKEVADFDGVKGGKRYLYLDEMLTRNLLRLDTIETEGNEALRVVRKSVIGAINACIHELDANARAPVEEQSRDAAEAAAAMDVDVPKENGSAEGDAVNMQSEQRAADEGADVGRGNMTQVTSEDVPARASGDGVVEEPSGASAREPVQEADAQKQESGAPDAVAASVDKGATSMESALGAESADNGTPVAPHQEDSVPEAKLDDASDAQPSGNTLTKDN